MGKDNLNAKQKSFCREYLIDSNGTQAAIRAGYSKHTANEQAAQLLAKLNIKNYLAKLTEKQVKRTEITADYILSSIKEIGERCLQREPVIVNGEKTGEYKFDSSGANKAFENLGRHQKLFTDKVEESGKKTVVIVDLQVLTDEQLKQYLSEDK